MVIRVSCILWYTRYVCRLGTTEELWEFIMTLLEFKHSIAEAHPPAELSRPLQALWHDAKGNWDTAHRLAQEQEDEVGSWVHAYLHRVEGDSSNAAYWYRKAGRPVSTLTLEQEHEEIAADLLGR